MDKRMIAAIAGVVIGVPAAIAALFLMPGSVDVTDGFPVEVVYPLPPAIPYSSSAASEMPKAGPIGADTRRPSALPAPSARRISSGAGSIRPTPPRLRGTEELVTPVTPQPQSSPPTVPESVPQVVVPVGMREPLVSEPLVAGAVRPPIPLPAISPQERGPSSPIRVMLIPSPPRPVPERSTASRTPRIRPVADPVASSAASAVEAARSALRDMRPR